MLALLRRRQAQRISAWQEGCLKLCCKCRSPWRAIWQHLGAACAGDAGGSWCSHVGNASYFDVDRLTLVDNQMDHMKGAYLGNVYSDDDVASYLVDRNIPSTRLDDSELYSHVAQLMDAGNVIGWFQGAMEFGPRALGNRSIVGDRNREMQTVMNLKIKTVSHFALSLTVWLRMWMIISSMMLQVLICWWSRMQSPFVCPKPTNLFRVW